MKNLSGVVWLLILLPLVVLVPVMIFVGLHGTWSLTRGAGLTLAAVGLIGISIARVNLGNSFSIAPEARRLVTHGVYAYLRHPVYVFGILLIAGFALYIPFLPLLLILIFILPMQVIRVREEERVLEEAFGDEYREYKRRTWF